MIQWYIYHLSVKRDDPCLESSGQHIIQVVIGDRSAWQTGAMHLRHQFCKWWFAIGKGKNSQRRYPLSNLSQISLVTVMVGDDMMLGSDMTYGRDVRGVCHIWNPKACGVCWHHGDNLLYSGGQCSPSVRLGRRRLCISMILLCSTWAQLDYVGSLCDTSLGFCNVVCKGFHFPVIKVVVDKLKLIPSLIHRTPMTGRVDLFAHLFVFTINLSLKYPTDTPKLPGVPIQTLPFPVCVYGRETSLPLTKWRPSWI